MPTFLMSLFLSCAAAVGSEQGAAPKEQAYPAKPAHWVVTTSQRPDMVCVKFRDGLVVRAREGALTDVGTGALKGAAEVLDGLKGGTWERVHELAEEDLEQFCKQAAANLGAPVADLNLYFHLRLPAGADVAATIDALNALECVEMAQGVHVPPALPLPPNYQPQQGYLRATTGTGAETVWTLPSGKGQGIRVCDIEYNWTAGHNDLPTVTRIGPVGTPLDPDHGTAVLGQMVSLANGWGTTGACGGVAPYFSHAYVNNTYNLSTAITRTFTTMRAGDVILIEQQWDGPRFAGGFDQFGYVPSEWYRPHYDAIRVAVGLGIVVVTAAGNGSQNLDDAIYSQGNGGHWPFLEANDSGSIIVGAAASPGGSSTARSRLWYSNYGATVDLQGWGENIYTCGYGDIFFSEGMFRWYTGDFGGTSGASPIVTSAAAQLQAVHKAVMGAVLTPAQVKAALQGTGLAQSSGQYPATQAIGPMPDVRAAIMSVIPADDCDGNGMPDRIDIVAGAAEDVNGNFVPDECESLCAADFNRDGNRDPDDLADFITCFFLDVMFPGTCAGAGGADFNGDGFRDPDDLADFITGFFLGC